MKLKIKIIAMTALLACGGAFAATPSTIRFIEVNLESKFVANGNPGVGVMGSVPVPSAYGTDVETKKVAQDTKVLVGKFPVDRGREVTVWDVPDRYDITSVFAKCTIPPLPVGKMTIVVEGSLENRIISCRVKTS